MADAKEPGNVRNYCGNNNSINEQIQVLTCKVVRIRTRYKSVQACGFPSLVERITILYYVPVFDTN